MDGVYRLRRGRGEEAVIRHSEIAKPELIRLIKDGTIVAGGHAGLKIYGTLT